ncbi:MAG: GNAT family N-acetyltransferase [Myxococcales bacterium]|nr:GNAT family N-acetyltransferase [Myxococcales bacterium]
MRRELTTARARLRPVHGDDLDALLRLLHEPGVLRYLCDGELVSRELVAEWARRSAAAFARGDAGLWVARERDAPGLLALVGFTEFYDPPVTELVIAVTSARWRVGFGVELAAAVIDWARAHAGHTTVRASTDEPNDASRAMLARLGFAPRSSSTPPGSPWRQLHFVLE